MSFIDNLLSEINKIGLTEADGKIFIALYLLTVVPCWFFLFKVIQSIKNKTLHKVIIHGGILFFLLALPYLFAFLSIQSAPWQLGLALLIILGSSFYKLITQTHFYSVWDIYAKYYDVLLNLIPYKKLVNEISDRIVKFKDRGKVLEVGIGTGNIISALLSKGNFEVHGIERSISMIRVAQKKVKNIQIYQFDLNSKEADNLPNNFDVLVFNNVLYSLDNPYTVITSFIEKLKPGGIILISEPHDKSSVFGIIKNHFKDRGLVASFFDLFRYFIPFFYVFILNFYISAKKGVKKYTFFQGPELITFIESKHCEILESGLCYGKENIFVVAKHN